MTTYITQTIARHHVEELVEQARRDRIGRELRRARRAARVAARESSSGTGSGRRTRRDPWMQYLVPTAR